MSRANDRTDLPVLLLYNLDHSWTNAELKESLIELERLDSALRELGHPVTLAPVETADLEPILREHRPEDYIVFNWCEGLPGVPYSDALIARTLEALNFAYTGSTAKVLEISQDKPQVKRLLDAAGVPTPEWRVYESAQLNGWRRFPAIVKPAHEHCSFGVTSEAVVFDPEELRSRVAYVLDEFHQPAVVEDFIDGREFHVALWGNGSIQMLPPAEMDFSMFSSARDRLCTYDSKFNPESVHYNKIGLLLPAPLSQDEYQLLETVSTAAYRTLGCRDYARLDIRLRDGAFYVLDVNPNADISSEASIACAAQVLGYSYGMMGSHLVNLAAARHPTLGA